MKQIGQVFTHQVPISEADQGLLHDEIMRARMSGSLLEGQTTGWATKKRLVDEYPLNVMGMYAHIITDLMNNVSPSKNRTRFWFVALEQNGQIAMHDHHQSDWAAVFYPHGVEYDDGGAIMFEDGTTIRPHAGLAVFFPGTLRHRVRIYKGRATRLSIAFNRDA